MKLPSTAPRGTALASISILFALVLGGCGGGSGAGSGVGSSESSKYKIAPDARSCEDLANLPLSFQQLQGLARDAIERAEKSGARGVDADAVAVDIQREIESLCAQRGGDFLPVSEAVRSIAGGLTRASAPPPADEELPGDQPQDPEAPAVGPPAVEPPPAVEELPGDQPQDQGTPDHEPPAVEPPTHEPPAPEPTEPPHTGVG